MLGKPARGRKKLNILTYIALKSKMRKSDKNRRELEALLLSRFLEDNDHDILDYRFVNIIKKQLSITTCIMTSYFAV